MGLRLPELRDRHADRSRWWDLVMAGLLLGSVAVAFWHETTANERTEQILAIVDLVLVVFFLSEFYWRVMKSAPNGRQYALRNCWELLGMVPVFLPLPGFLRALRLVRLIRILRVFKVVGRRLGVWERLAKEGHIGQVAGAAGLVTLTGSTLVWLMERADNAALANWGEALWWGIVTVTTVGYGDITPISATGRFIAAMLMVTGIGTVATLASTLSSVLVREPREGDPEPGAIADLERLAELYASGALSDDEYTLAKAKVLE